MKPRRIQRQIEQTPEELAELAAFRERMQREKPGPDDLDPNEWGEPHPQGEVLAFLSAIVELKEQREQLGLTQGDVSKRSGLDVGMLSRLENGKILNPTWSTLSRYADAVGMQLTVSVEPLPVGAGPALK